MQVFLVAEQDGQVVIGQLFLAEVIPILHDVAGNRRVAHRLSEARHHGPRRNDVRRLARVLNRHVQHVQRQRSAVQHALRIVDDAAELIGPLLNSVENGRRRRGVVALEEGVDPKLAKARQRELFFNPAPAVPVLLDQRLVDGNVVIDGVGRFLERRQGAGARGRRRVDRAEIHRCGKG